MVVDICSRAYSTARAPIGLVLVWYWARTKPFGIGLVLVFSHMTGLTVIGNGFRTSDTTYPAVAPT
jgi:hypothetical protein